MPVSRSDPLPAMRRSVSGRKTTIAPRVRDDIMRRKMKIERKPKKFANKPPSTGPMAILKFRTRVSLSARFKS